MEKNESTVEFNNLPIPIKDWISSLQATYLIMEINKKLGLFNGEREVIIPSLIFKLITKSVDPSDFVNELSHELNISFENAKTITEDIEKNVLHPIEIDLRGDIGIDIKLFYIGKPKPKNQPDSVKSSISSEFGTVSKIAQPKQEGPVIDLQSFKIKSDWPLSPLTFAPAMKEEKNTSESLKEEELINEIAVPFILHQEFSPTTAPTLNQRPQEVHSPKTSLTMKVQNYYQSLPTPERTVPRPVSIKVESSFGSQVAAKTPSTGSGQATTHIEQQIPITLSNSQSELSGEHSVSQNVIAKQPTIPAPKGVGTPTESVVADNSSQSYGARLPDGQGQAPSATLPPSQSYGGQAGQVRVVHYSTLRTPLNVLGVPKKETDKANVVDLRKLS